jgi:hypothetical protein
MSDERLPNTKTVHVQLRDVVIRADPDWARDHKLVMQDDRRPKVLIDWQNSGPYAGTDHRRNTLPTGKHQPRSSPPCK